MQRETTQSKVYKEGREVGTFLDKSWVVQGIWTMKSSTCNGQNIQILVMTMKA